MRTTPSQRRHAKRRFKTVEEATRCFDELFRPKESFDFKNWDDVATAIWMVRMITKARLAGLGHLLP